MENLTFKEIVGNASTTASLKGKVIGRNVNACAYTKESSDNVFLVLESNGERVHGTPIIELTQDQYHDVKHGDGYAHVAGIELFGAEV